MIVKIFYHLRKANSIANVLSRNEETRLMAIQVFHSEIQKEINELELEIVMRSLPNLIIHPTLFKGIKEAQLVDPELAKIWKVQKRTRNYFFPYQKKGILYMDGRLCIPNNKELRK